VVPSAEATIDTQPATFLQEGLARTAEAETSTVPGPEPTRLFPLILPSLGGLMGADLPAWHRAVAQLFQRLDALDREPEEQSGWARLGPWCATIGAVTVALEIVRRRLGKQTASISAAGRGRGLAWRWSHDPEGRKPSE
jgi:hypothetical protein